MCKFYEELSDKVWKTKRSRFYAYRRIKRRRYGSYVILSLFSVIIIGINLLVFLDEYKECSNEITIFTITLSVLILVVNLLVGQLNYQKREEDYLQCGIELDDFNQRLHIIIELGDLPTLDEMKEMVNSYNRILMRYKENHTTLDYQASQYCYDYSQHKSFYSFFVMLYSSLKWYLLDINTLFIGCGILVGVMTFKILGLFF